MYISCQALALAVLALDGAVASPAHRHHHHHAHKRGLVDVLNKRTNFNNPDLYDHVDWSKALDGVNWGKVFGKSGSSGGSSGASSSAPATSPSTAPAKPASPAAEEKDAVQSPAAQPTVAAQSSSGSSTAPSSSPSSDSSSDSGSGGSGSCVDISAVWSKGDTSKSGPTAATAGGQGWTDADSSGASKVKRQDGNLDVGYIGNTGGSQYGSNIIPLSDCNNQDHQYTIKFTNQYPDQRDMAVMIWNKPGYDGQANSGLGYNSYFMIDLPYGKSAAFAFEPNTEMAFSESSDSCTRQESGAGAWNCVWGEANFYPEGPNMDTNSWDVSGMINPNDPLSTPGSLTLSDGSPSGSSSKANCGFFSSTTFYAGQGSGGQGSCNPNIPKGQPAHLTATFGVDN